MEPLKPIIQAEEVARQKARERRDHAEARFPLFFGMAATFGLVSILYGFEKLIDRVDLFVNNPWILLVTGLAILVITGAAYRKLN